MVEVRHRPGRTKPGKTSSKTGGPILDLTSDGMRKANTQRISQECERLLCLFYYLEDHGRSVECIGLFSDAPVLKVMPDVGVWKGKDNILNGLRVQDEVIRGGIRMVHQYHNFLLTSASNGEATGTAYFTMYKSSAGPVRGVPDQGYVAKLEQPMLVGETRDRFVNTRSGWRIAEHEIIYLFDIDAGKRRRESAYAKFKKFAAPQANTVGVKRS